jgi:hypothetical protein
MAIYDPTQNLSWKYKNSSGELFIVDLVDVQLGTNEKVNVTKTNVSKRACTVTLTVVSGLNNIPATSEPYYTNIGAGLNTEANVRARINTLQMVNVTVEVKKNNVLVSGSTDPTTAGTGIIID